MVIILWLVEQMSIGLLLLARTRAIVSNSEHKTSLAMNNSLRPRFMSFVFAAV